MKNWTKIDSIFMWIVILCALGLALAHICRLMNRRPLDDIRIQIDCGKRQIEDFSGCCELRIDTVYLTSNTDQL